MDRDQVVLLERIFGLLHEGIKIALLIKIVTELSKAQEEIVRQNLVLALGAILNLSPYLKTEQFGEMY